MKTSLLLKCSERKEKDLNMPAALGIKENTRRILMLFGPTLQLSLYAVKIDILLFSTGCGCTSSTDALQEKERKKILYLNTCLKENFSRCC